MASSLGAFTVRSTGNPVPAVSISGGTLPPGLTLVDNGDGTATISGVPGHDAIGSHVLTISATKAAGATTQRLVLTVEEFASIPTLRGPGLLALGFLLALAGVLALRKWAGF